jgi:hypothetical protein
MLKELGREMRAVAVGEWPDPPLPVSAGARRRVAATLVLLALAGLAAYVVSFLAE